MRQTLLIADKGKTAVRIAKAAADLGWHSFISREVLEERPAGRPRADADRVLRAAARAGADHVHPGRGALSLDAHFVRRCAQAGLTVIGPPPDVLKIINDRGHVRALAGAVGVPVAPGPSGPVSWEDAGAFLSSLRGQAMLLRPVSHRRRPKTYVIRDAAGLRQARARLDGRLDGRLDRAGAASAEAGVRVEEFVEHARRVEVQTAGDGRLVAHLWERQPFRGGTRPPGWLAPAADLPASTRFLLLDAALRLADALAYPGVGTMTFLLSPTRRFFLTGIDPRLHSGHFVTERLAGLDLFATQLRLARGDRIGDLGLEEHLRPSLPLPDGTATVTKGPCRPRTHHRRSSS
ncbi:biotin carboxylase N-terminal domain-containing protein [Actinomadura chokoriensis]|uniref:Biotin carboxylase N-terminal domain-containing protein n=1 Tax=Actinomadura chokoriensis TaxID=454156 RepID=A0ABV4R7L1_9ACTN